RHTRFSRDWSSDVCSSDLLNLLTYVLHLTVPKEIRYWTAMIITSITWRVQAISMPMLLNVTARHKIRVMARSIVLPVVAHRVTVRVCRISIFRMVRFYA